jgi:hypothetical protein
VQVTLDVPAAFLEAIRADPDDAGTWSDLAAWLWVEGQRDEAAAVREHWRTLRDRLTFASLEDTLADVARNAKPLAQVAREVARRDDESRTGDTGSEP